MKIKLLLLFLFTIALTFSCQQEKNQAGICLSFDDRTIKEWFALRDLFNQYEVKATFFISQFDSLAPDEIEMLHQFEKDGHEIASHGALHIQAEKYIKENSYKKYMALEIKPSIESMKKQGFNPVSFAYPYGSKYWFTDFMLLHKFKSTRGVASYHTVKDLKNKDLASVDEIYFDFDGERKLSSFEIDRKLQLTQEIMLSGLNRAEKRGEVIMLFAHVPSTDINNPYSFDVDFLKFILEEAKKRNMKFYRFKDLVD